MLIVLGGTQFQISPGPYEVTSVNKLMSSGLSVGQTVSRWVGPEIHDIPWCLAQESFRSWGGLPRVELRGILRMCAPVVVAAGKEGYGTWLLAATGVIDLDRYKAPLSKIS